MRACVREVYKMSWNQRSLKVHLHDRQKSQNLRFVRLQTCVSCSKCFSQKNKKMASINRAPDGSTYPGKKQVHSVFGKINYGDLKHNSLYLDLIPPSGG